MCIAFSDAFVNMLQTCIHIGIGKAAVMLKAVPAIVVVKQVLLPIDPVLHAIGQGLAYALRIVQNAMCVADRSEFVAGEQSCYVL